MSDSQICRLVQEMSQTLTLWRNVSVWKSPSKGWWPGWFWSGCFPIFWRARFPGQWRCFIECCRCAPLSWRGTRSSFQSRQLKSATGIRGRLQMARLGLPCLFLSIARSPSCVLARTRVCFLPTVLDKCTWRPIRATLVLYGGICRSNLMATPVVLFKMVMDVSHARLRQGVFADGLARCWRAVAVLDWVGRKERYQVLFSVLDFFVQPNLELQQP